MRLAGQLRAGFYPAPPEAIAAILRHLRLPPEPPPSADMRVCIIDPCAGEGKALADIHLGLSFYENPGIEAYAVELNASRCERIREGYPGIHLLGPCSFHAASIGRNFGLLYLNPPFDDEYGGGRREEQSFLDQADRLLCPGGILAFVLPYNQVLGRSDMIAALDMGYEDLEIYLFPDGHRAYRECVVFGRRRKQWLSTKLVREHGLLHRRGMQYRYNRHTDADVADIPRLGETQYDIWKVGKPVEMSRRERISTWTVPYTVPPKQWTKTDLTSEEVEQELARSPLHAQLQTQAYAPMRRPPLPLNRGHTSLLLLTGLLDGYVPSEPPHVVRGYCGKESKHIRTEEYTTPSGTHVEKRTSAEQPQPVVRAVWPDGEIRTFTDRKPATTVTDDFTIEETQELEDDHEEG